MMPLCNSRHSELRLSYLMTLPSRQFRNSFIHSLPSIGDEVHTSSKASSPQSAIQFFSFIFPYRLFPLRSSKSCLLLLPPLLVRSTVPSVIHMFHKVGPTQRCKQTSEDRLNGPNFSY
jgi:hypothetical protein